MTISYNWLSQYLPEKLSPEKLSGILTSIGLEVESLSAFEEIKGSLAGLVTGEVISCEKHPDADKLKVTTVFVGKENLLQIVCGAANVTSGQKVVVATTGTTIYPVTGDPITIKKAKIRGVESEGMICAEDEIGLGNSHDGIMVLPPETAVGQEAAAIFSPYHDRIFEIGLTPNRMDAMSHLGVARDICAWLSYHNNKPAPVNSPYPNNITTGSGNSNIRVTIENENACKRYSGIYISEITVKDSPTWLKQHLKSIGLKPINNIVDITNFILHETGQPLHAFDAGQITGNNIIVKNVAAGTLFKTLDEKERILSATDLMICNAAEPMCMAGVYGGINSGVNEHTKDILLESAWFDPSTIRKTALKHELRTDAATRFEKGTDISNTVNVLKRAAMLILDIAGGYINGEIIDVYPKPAAKTSVVLTYDYLKKLSGKAYDQNAVKNILSALGFDVLLDSATEITVAIPYSKPDISIPADLVEEIMRIDGLDNIEIPSGINIEPSPEKDQKKSAQKEKLANYLVGTGYFEIFTNSITNSAFYDEQIMADAVKMINSLSADLDMLRPQMIQSGLQVIAHNLNRKNHNLRLFEFGKTYRTSENKQYSQSNHLSLYVCGQLDEVNWKTKPQKADFFYLKGVVENVLLLAGIGRVNFKAADNGLLEAGSSIYLGKENIGYLGEVNEKLLGKFDIKQPVFYADLNWDLILMQKTSRLQYKEISRFPVVNRDLSVVVDKNVSYNQIEQIALSSKIDQLKSIQLFDVFESDKLGAGKKSLAVSFTFLDETKTLTDKEIDAFMQKIISGYEKTIQAEIRK